MTTTSSSQGSSGTLNEPTLLHIASTSEVSLTMLSNANVHSVMPTMPPRGHNQSFPELCYDLLESFQFPVFEVLVTLQIVLPVFYSFFIPCISVFVMECTCRNQPQDSVNGFRRKLSTTLVGSWVHWYMHWELWSWFWCSLSIYSTFFCAMPVRFYEYTIGLSITSVMVSYISNLLSDFRLRLPEGPLKVLFNLSFCFLCSWLLRFAYPCFLGVGIVDEFDFFWEDSEIEPTPPSTPPPPDYSDVVEEVAPPPSYTETLARIRAQVPKLQRSISLQGQKLGRSMSVRGSKRGTAAKKNSNSRKISKHLSTDV